MRRSDRIKAFVNVIWDWYGSHKRQLPWRDLSIPDDTERAYQILISEVMLQQTQVDRVRVIFVDFLRKFPRLRDLASASNKEVILAWRGMGYNSRALRLRDAVRTIVEKHDGVFPKDFAELIAIKGLGAYTAAAILNFAFNIPTPCIDTNIRRILHRTFVGPENADGTWEKDDGYLLKLAGEGLVAALQQQGVTLRDFAQRNRLEGCVGDAQRDGSRRPFGPPHHDTLLGVPRDARNWHAALMDFGSLVQTKSKPKWNECPLTARGLMRTTRNNFERSIAVRTKGKGRREKVLEPGRTINGRFTPNRIIRGRIVEALRDANAGLPLDAIGRTVCADWSPAHHRKWLQGIVEKLKRDRLVDCKGKRYVLAD